MNTEKLMTTKEYLAKKEQENIDKIFDDAIKEAKRKQVLEMKTKEHEEYMQKLFKLVGDYESEVLILEDVYRNMYEKGDCSRDDIEQIKEDIKQAKMRLTRTQNELEREIFKENAINKKTQ